MEDVKFRVASESDVVEIARIEKLSFKTPWSEEMISSEMKEPISRFVVAITGNHVIGYYGYLHVMDELHILNIAVDPDYRRKGIGSALMKNLLGESKTLSARAITLEVRESNTAAVHLYERAGFQLAGVRPHYYTDKENALIYWLEQK